MGFGRRSARKGESYLHGERAPVLITSSERRRTTTKEPKKPLVQSYTSCEARKPNRNDEKKEKKQTLDVLRFFLCGTMMRSRLALSVLECFMDLLGFFFILVPKAIKGIYKSGALMSYTGGFLIDPSVCLTAMYPRHKIAIMDSIAKEFREEDSVRRIYGIWPKKRAKGEKDGYLRSSRKNVANRGDFRSDREGTSSTEAKELLATRSELYFTREVEHQRTKKWRRGKANPRQAPRREAIYC
ncbi:hypothetical protein M5K25_025923 [Dendrobium thyrsiflorum]|uniref:Uncharacterized protein n=1 Tax=Dendrobium thyrsiflorum TaxID=117978 RepID=A0ABD0TW25_DENTH